RAPAAASPWPRENFRASCPAFCYDPGTMLEPGDKAPDFKLEGDDGKTHSLKEFSGKTLILYFYPKDNTPGCTTQACELRDGQASFKRRRRSWSVSAPIRSPRT